MLRRDLRHALEKLRKYSNVSVRQHQQLPLIEFHFHTFACLELSVELDWVTFVGQLVRCNLLVSLLIYSCRKFLIIATCYQAFYLFQNIVSAPSSIYIRDKEEIGAQIYHSW